MDYYSGCNEAKGRYYYSHPDLPWTPRRLNPEEQKELLRVMTELTQAGQQMRQTLREGVRDINRMLAELPGKLMDDIHNEVHEIRANMNAIEVEYESL